MEATVRGVKFAVSKQVPNRLLWQAKNVKGERIISEPKITSIKKHDRYNDTLVIRTGHTKYWFQVSDPTMESDQGLIVYMPGDEVYETKKDKEMQQEDKSKKRGRVKMK